MCYVNSVELTNGADTEVEDGDVIWCLRASPDMGHEIEILSVGFPSDASEAEVAGPFYAWTGGSASTDRVWPPLPLITKQSFYLFRDVLLGGFVCF